MGVICHRLQGEAVYVGVCGCEVCGVIRCYGAWKIGYKEGGVRVYSRIRSEMQFPQKGLFLRTNLAELAFLVHWFP